MSKVKVVPILNKTTSHEDLWGVVVQIHAFLNLGTLLLYSLTGPATTLEAGWALEPV
jgi:hypothetical protein